MGKTVVVIGAPRPRLDAAAKQSGALLPHCALEMSHG